jgi:mRNA interferase RelE/StbE
MTEETKLVWLVEIHDRVYKKLAKLPRPEREAILLALSNLQNDPFTLDLKPLRGRRDWRLRVGRWRILVRTDIEEKIVVVYDLGPRGDVYK